MMPVFLSLYVCVASGTACRAVIPTGRPMAGISACQVAGMMTAATWAAAHPGWVVRKIRCTIGERPKAEDQA